MPELPEVETVRRGLAPVMEGAVIAHAELRRPDLRFPFPVRFAEVISGQKVVSLGRRAKYLLIDLEGGDVIIAHLGMSGSFRVADAANEATPGDFHIPRGKDERHDHVVLHLDTAKGRCRVIYNDPRRFGFMDLARRERLAEHPYLRDLGEEPTGNALDAVYLATRLRGKSQPLKTALLDQKTIAGLGNIYV
ncbi:MAG TPA: DNA-formamidopyrimidine glycosylase family protein, partial [Mycoplana sp.]|nr:DNA-formamidopyrimidine glycosylase family protein [Mycoplana sp.]